MASPPGSPEPRRDGEAPRIRSGPRARPVDDDESSEDDIVPRERTSLGSLQSVSAALWCSIVSMSIRFDAKWALLHISLCDAVDALNT